MTRTFKEIAQIKIDAILEKFIIYLHDNFDPLQVRPYMTRDNFTHNKELRILIREEDNIVFHEHRGKIIGIWNNETNSIMELPNYFVDTIQYISFDFEYIVKKTNRRYTYTTNDERTYLKYIINEEFNINEDVYNIYILNIINEWRGCDDIDYYGDTEENLVERYIRNILLYLSYLIIVEEDEDTINIINRTLDNLNSYVLIK